MSSKKGNFADVFSVMGGNDVINQMKEMETVKSTTEDIKKEKKKKAPKIESGTDNKPVEDVKNVEDVENEKKVPEINSLVTNDPVEEVDTPTEEYTESDSSESIENSFNQEIMEKFNFARKKPTIEETHTRNTIFLENDLHKRMSKITKGKRGLKTMLINEAVKVVLDIVEGKKQ